MTPAECKEAADRLEAWGLSDAAAELRKPAAEIDADRIGGDLQSRANIMLVRAQLLAKGKTDLQEAARLREVGKGLEPIWRRLRTEGIQPTAPPSPPPTPGPLDIEAELQSLSARVKAEIEQRGAALDPQARDKLEFAERVFIATTRLIREGPRNRKGAAVNTPPLTNLDRARQMVDRYGPSVLAAYMGRRVPRELRVPLNYIAYHRRDDRQSIFSALTHMRTITIALSRSRRLSRADRIHWRRVKCYISIYWDVIDSANAGRPAWTPQEEAQMLQSRIDRDPWFRPGRLKRLWTWLWR